MHFNRVAQNCAAVKELSTVLGERAGLFMFLKLTSLTNS
jgi:hypothetical protein